jgi:hypothetical protein
MRGKNGIPVAESKLWKQELQMPEMPESLFGKAGLHGGQGRYGLGQEQTKMGCKMTELIDVFKYTPSMSWTELMDAVYKVFKRDITPDKRLHFYDDSFCWNDIWFRQNNMEIAINDTIKCRDKTPYEMLCFINSMVPKIQELYNLPK